MTTAANLYEIATPVCFDPRQEPPSAVALCTRLRAQWLAMTQVLDTAMQTFKLQFIGP